MQKMITAFLLILAGQVSFGQLQASLTAAWHPDKALVSLDWNMVNAEGRTAYIILKSTDDNTWTEVAKDRMFRNYSGEDAFYYEDRMSSDMHTRYRLRIIDAQYNTVALSPIISVGNLISTANPSSNRSSNTSARINRDAMLENNNLKWAIYPNPVHDVLTLNNQGSGNLQGSINISIMDMSGKVVIRFRCSTTTRVIQIPVDNIAGGTYQIQLSVSNNVLLNQRFIKQ